MKMMVAAVLMLSAADVSAQDSATEYPSCKLKTQHALKGGLGGSITDPRQAHISVRANILEADLSTARKARLLSQTTTDKLYKHVEVVRAGADRYTKRQGFLSAGELASYDRELDAVAMQVCSRAIPAPQCQSASKKDPLSASKRDPFVERCDGYAGVSLALVAA